MAHVPSARRKEMNGFRLIGLMGQGSTLWVMAGFVALLVVGYIRDYGLTLSASRKKEATMKKAKVTLRVPVSGVLNTVWAIGASVMAVPLSA